MYLINWLFVGSAQCIIRDTHVKLPFLMDEQGYHGTDWLNTALQNTKMPDGQSHYPIG